MISRKANLQFINQHPDAGSALQHWFHDRQACQVDILDADMRQRLYPHADLVDRQELSLISPAMRLPTNCSHQLPEIQKPYDIRLVKNILTGHNKSDRERLVSNERLATARRPLNVKRYGKTTGTVALPMVITTESEYDRIRATVKELMSRDEDDLSAEEVKLLDLLVTLIDRYEETHYAIERGTAHEILHHLMEARGLTHKDVWKLFGSKGVASEVLNGKRAISKTHARALADFFHVSVDLFIDQEPLAAARVNP